MPNLRLPQDNLDEACAKWQKASTNQLSQQLIRYARSTATIAQEDDRSRGNTSHQQKEKPSSFNDSRLTTDRTGEQKSFENKVGGYRVVLDRYEAVEAINLDAAKPRLLGEVAFEQGGK